MNALSQQKSEIDAIRLNARKSAHIMDFGLQRVELAAKSVNEYNKAKEEELEYYKVESIKEYEQIVQSLRVEHLNNIRNLELRLEQDKMAIQEQAREQAERLFNIKLKEERSANTIQTTTLFEMINNNEKIISSLRLDREKERNNHKLEKESLLRLRAEQQEAIRNSDLEKRRYKEQVESLLNKQTIEKLSTSKSPPTSPRVNAVLSPRATSSLKSPVESPVNKSPVTVTSPSLYSPHVDQRRVDQVLNRFENLLEDSGNERRTAIKHKSLISDVHQIISSLMDQLNIQNKKLAENDLLLGNLKKENRQLKINVTAIERKYTQKVKTDEKSSFIDDTKPLPDMYVNPRDVVNIDTPRPSVQGVPAIKSQISNKNNAVKSPDGYVKQYRRRGESLTSKQTETVLDTSKASSTKVEAEKKVTPISVPRRSIANIKS
ncbi:hypothetical protein AKO1_005289 [Acrasis kona]|uniref:Uncharacterized protein n=1 Tax=Acrasis kona TaxID=1008807 RepID=A0AAW2YLB7_9EUKA